MDGGADGRAERGRGLRPLRRLDLRRNLGGSDNLERLLWVYSNGFLASVWRVWEPHYFDYEEFSTQSAYNWRPRGLAVSAP